MREFRLKINMDNAAFDTNGDLEIVRILRVLASWIDIGSDTNRKTFALHDVNGNKVGLAEFTHSEKE